MIEGTRMRQARGERSLKQVERDTGISRGLVSRLESGRRHDAYLSTVEKLARYYGVTVNDLLGVQ